jgi:hypothetical protein
MLSRVSALKKKAGQKNRDCYKYQFCLEALCVSKLQSLDVPSGSSASIQVARGAKVVTTVPAEVTQGQASWSQPLEFVATLYTSKKSDRAFSEKEFKVTVLIAVSGKRPREVASAELDIGAFGSLTTDESVYNHSLRLTPRARGLAKGVLPELSTKLTASFLSGMDDDDKSISSMPVGRTQEPTPSIGGDSDQQDLTGFDDAASDSGASDSSVCSGASEQRAARRDAAVAELRNLKIDLEAKGKPRISLGGPEQTALQAQVESLRSELIDCQVREAQARVQRDTAESELTHERETRRVEIAQLKAEARQLESNQWPVHAPRVSRNRNGGAWVNYCLPRTDAALVGPHGRAGCGGRATDRGGDGRVICGHLRRPRRAGCGGEEQASAPA